MRPVFGLLIGYYSLSDLVDLNEYRAENSFIMLVLFIKRCRYFVWVLIRMRQVLAFNETNKNMLKLIGTLIKKNTFRLK